MVAVVVEEVLVAVMVVVVVVVPVEVEVEVEVQSRFSAERHERILVSGIRTGTGDVSKFWHSRTST